MYELAFKVGPNKNVVLFFCCTDRMSLLLIWMINSVAGGVLLVIYQRAVTEES